MPLSKEDILALADRRETKVVTIDGFGDFTLKELSGTDRDAYEQSLVRVDGKGNASSNLANARAKLVGYCLVDDAGERIFTSANDIADLGKLPAKLISKLFDEAAEMNGLSDDEVEELLGNSDAATSGASTSD